MMNHNDPQVLAVTPRSASTPTSTSLSGDHALYPSVARFAAATAGLLLLTGACSLLAQSTLKTTAQSMNPAKLMAAKPNMAASSLHAYLDRVHAETSGRASFKRIDLD